MKKTAWKNRIKKACIAANTYQPHYDNVIDALANIMAIRDSAMDSYIQSGSVPVVEHTNKGGATNIVKNPALVVVMDCDKQALAYWRDLGLTPMGMKRLGEKGIVKESEGGFAEVLARLGV